MVLPYRVPPIWLTHIWRGTNFCCQTGTSSLIPHRLDDTSGGSVVPEARPSHGYKPFLERLKPPTFSGKVEDWPEFRSVWKDLLSDYPESVQVQHLKSNIPSADAKRVVGVKSMDEMWRRLEKVYGDEVAWN